MSIWAEGGGLADGRWDMQGFEARDAMAALYGQLRTMAQALAHKGQKLTLRVSPRTYNEHLEGTPVAVGPWDWDIDDTLEFGKVLCCVALATEGPNVVGTVEAGFSITDGVIVQ